MSNDIEVLAQQTKLKEAQIEHIKVKAKWDIKLSHAYSMMAIKMGIILVILAIVIGFFLKGG